MLAHNSCSKNLVRGNYKKGKKAKEDIFNCKALQITQNTKTYKNNEYHNLNLKKPRIFDGFNENGIYEIKNVRYQPMTSQLNDYIEIAKYFKTNFFLLIKKRNELTKLTSKSLRAHIQGEIEEFEIEGEIWLKIPLYIHPKSGSK
ncbi:MAG: hypothetical protein IJZ10_06055 [Thermoguttaceae bacterium]|nr:hypothetical protein [Thermoguttaceae bacterium]